MHCLSEFRVSYVFNALQQIYKNDTILRNMLGLDKKNKSFTQGLASDLEVHCSLSFSLHQPPKIGNLQAILITVDSVGMLRVYSQMSDQSELLFKIQLKFQSSEDFATCVEFYIKARAIIVGSNLGQSIVITRDLK